MNENLTEGGLSRPGRRAAAAATQESAFAVPEIVAPSDAPLTRRALREQAAAPVPPLPPAREVIGYRPPAAYAREILAMPATISPVRVAPAPPVNFVAEMVTVPRRRIEHAPAQYVREVLAMPATVPAPGIPPQEGFFTGPAPLAPEAPEQVPAPPRRVRTETGYRPSADYAREVLAMPATVPPVGIPAAEETIDFAKLIADEAPVDFDRMIAEEAAPDFEQLAAAEADAAFRMAMLPPGTAPAGAGGLNDFAVYGDPEPIRPEVIRPQNTFPATIKAALDAPSAAYAPAATSPPAPPSASESNPLLAVAGAGGLNDFAVYGEPETGRAKAAPSAAASNAPDRDLGITEKPDFYAVPTSGDIVHDVRFSPGKTLSVNHRRVYRADNRGLPIFSPGWTARMAAAHYRRGLYMAVTVAFLITAVSGGMVYFAVGADSNYVTVSEKGVPVDATVAAVTSDVAKNESSNTNSNDATTTETASVKFEINGKPYTRNITDTSTDPTAILGVGSAWKAGDKIRVYADLEHSGQVIREDTSQPGRFNFLSLSPLLLAAAFGAGAVAAGINTGKMMRIDNAETAAARDQKE